MNEKMKQSTCCFTGHRRLYHPVNELRDRLRLAVLSMYARGVNNFCCGGALGFDTIAAQTVLELKAEYENIALRLILPCKDQTNGWSPENVRIYEEIKSKADDIIYVCDSYKNGCMQMRNRRLVDESAYCISYLIKSSGGTAGTVRYALEKGITVVNLETGQTGVHL